MSTIKRGKQPLLITNPDLAKEWDYEKNAPLTPNDVTAGSQKKVWWKCVYDHIWDSTINNRAKGNGCPYCTGRIAIPGYNDLKTLFPLIADEWDYKKNRPLTPDKVLPHSERKVWWIGRCGHSWETAICNRTKGKGCIYCLGKAVLKGFNDLSTVNPQLAEEWNFERNKDLKTKRGIDISTPDKVMRSSNYKVWWRCKYGHEWEATINHRDAHRNCPLCLGAQTSMPEQSISYYLEKCCIVHRRERINNQEVDVYLPEYEIGIEYDGKYYHQDPRKDELKTSKLLKAGVDLYRIKESDRNEYCDGHIILYNEDRMGKNFEWACRKLMALLASSTKNESFNKVRIDIKHDYTRIRERFDLVTKENSLAVCYPDLVKEWNSDKNGNLTPDMFAKQSNQLVWWKCINGHEWCSTINNRTGSNKNCCPYCSNKKVLTGFNDLATKNPALASEWNYEKNGSLLPTKVMPKTNRIVWWKCKNGHEWKASINSRAYGIGCPFCYGRYSIPGQNDLQTLFPKIAEEWNDEKNGDLKPSDVTAYSHAKVWWICKNGHEWESIISNRTGVSKNGCPYCSGKHPRAVICIETGIVYKSVAEAKRETGATKVSECCNGKRKISGGYHWKYVE